MSSVCLIGVQGGDLMRAIAQDTKNELRWSRKGGLLMLDIARGLTYLHSNRVSRHTRLFGPECVCMSSAEASVKLVLHTRDCLLCGFMRKLVMCIAAAAASCLIMLLQIVVFSNFGRECPVPEQCNV